MSEIIRNCRMCKEPMESSPFMLCPTCLADSDRVQSFIRKHPLASLEDISRSTRIPCEKLQGMIHLGKRESPNL